MHTARHQFGMASVRKEGVFGKIPVSDKYSEEMYQDYQHDCASWS